MTDAEAQAQLQRAQGGKRASKAPSKAEMKRMTDSMGSAEKKPKGKLGPKARAVKKASLTNPPESVKPYDFERAAKTKPGVNVTSLPAEPYRGGVGSETESGLTKNFKAPAKPVAAPMASKPSVSVDETPTQTFKIKAPKAAKTIAQELDDLTKEMTDPKRVPNVKSELPGQGSMVGKPVEQAVVRSNAKGNAPTAQVTTPAAKPITGPPKVAPATVSSPVTAAADPAKMTSADLFGEGPAKPGVLKMTAEDLFGGPTPTAKGFAEKAVSKIRTRAASEAGFVWEGVKGIGKALDPTSAYRALPKDRTSWQVAKSAVSGVSKVGKNVVKGVAAGILTDYAGQMGYKLGGVINKGPGQAEGESQQFNPLTAGYNVTKAAMSAFDNEGELAKIRSQGRKQGLKVTGGDSGFTAVGKGLVGALTAGRVDLGNEVKVEEAPGARSLREKRIAKGEAKRKANTSGDSFSEADYQKLKQTASRNVVKGTYRG